MTNFENKNPELRNWLDDPTSQVRDRAHGGGRGPATLRLQTGQGLPLRPRQRQQLPGESRESTSELTAHAAVQDEVYGRPH